MMKKIKDRGTIKTTGIIVGLVLMVVAASVVSYIGMIKENNKKIITEKNIVNSAGFTLGPGNRLFDCIFCCAPHKGEPGGGYQECINRCLPDGMCDTGPAPFEPQKLEINNDF
jgi:hypothetical protein